jgi:hypothetical protein|nr:MAG TPA: hypothetical protein [Caudoviricetes sp.]
MKIKTARIIATLDYNHRVILNMNSMSRSSKIRIVNVGKDAYLMQGDHKTSVVNKEELIASLEHASFFIESWHA